MSSFRKKQLGENTFAESIKDQSIPTGFTILDLANGKINQENGSYEAGFRSGRIVTITGWSGTGKSTLAQQLMFNSVKQYDNSDIYYHDAEKSADIKARFQQLWFGLSPRTKEALDEFHEKVFVESEKTYTDDLVEYVQATYKFKMEHIDELTITIKGYDGKDHKVLTPSYVVCDSLSATFARDLCEAVQEKGELSSATAGAQQAARNSDAIGKLKDILYKANIILVLVAHLTKKTSMGTPEPSPCPFIPPNETVKGGNAPIYYMDYGLKIFRGKTLTEDKDYGIRGFINEIQVLKTRSSATAGMKFPMVFDSTFGYDNDLSNLEFLFQKGEIKTAGPYSVFPALPDLKFTKRKYREVIAEHPELADAIESKVIEIMTGKMYNNPIGFEKAK